MILFNGLNHVGNYGQYAKSNGTPYCLEVLPTFKGQSSPAIMPSYTWFMRLNFPRSPCHSSRSHGYPT
jgi:hypothetical protein